MKVRYLPSCSKLQLTHSFAPVSLTNRNKSNNQRNILHLHTKLQRDVAKKK